MSQHRAHVPRGHGSLWRARGWQRCGRRAPRPPVPVGPGAAALCAGLRTRAERELCGGRCWRSHRCGTKRGRLPPVPVCPPIGGGGGSCLGTGRDPCRSWERPRPPRSVRGFYCTAAKCAAELCVLRQTRPLLIRALLESFTAALRRDSPVQGSGCKMQVPPALARCGHLVMHGTGVRMREYSWLCKSPVKGRVLLW